MRKRTWCLDEGRSMHGAKAPICDGCIYQDLPTALYGEMMLRNGHRKGYVWPRF